MEHVTLEVLFALSLGPYESEAAVRTLPAQLDLLRVFRGLARRNVALVYRLQTERESRGGVAAHFSLLCIGRTGHELSQDERTSLLDQAAVTLVPGWSLGSLASTNALPRLKYRARLEPCRPDVALPIKSDWAALVDLVRRRDTDVAIDLVCSIAETNGAEPLPAQRVDLHHHIDMGAPGQLEASQFFCAISPIGLTASDRHQLALSLVVHAETEPDPVFLGLVGQTILGIPTQVARVTRSVLFPSDVSRSAIGGPPEVILRAFHPPYGHIEGRGLEGASATAFPVRFHLPDGEDGLTLGTAIQQGPGFDEPVPVRMADRDRVKHTYVLGKTGSGKTNLLMNLVRQDIEAGKGVAVIDPHGPLVDYALAHCGDRRSDVVLLDFSDSESLPKLNPLNIDCETPAAAARAVDELVEILVRKTFNQFAGPIFEDTVQTILGSVRSPEVAAIAEPSIPVAMELLRRKGARTWLAESLLSNEEARQEWVTFNDMAPHTIAEHVRWVLAKFAEFSSENPIYGVSGASISPLSFERLFSDGGVLLVKIPESSLGSRACGIIGSIVFSRLHRAARSGGRDASNPFMVYLDEFQKFVDIELEEMVAEARKFGLALTFAHQNTRQLEAFSRYEGTSNPRLREAIFSNVGTMVVMKTSGHDVAAVATELAVSEGSVRRIGQYDALVRAVLDDRERSPFTIKIPHAQGLSGDDKVAAAIRSRMIQEGYWAPREELVAYVDNARAAVNAACRPSVPASAATEQQQYPSSFADSWTRRKMAEHNDRVAQRASSLDEQARDAEEDRDGGGLGADA